MGNDKERQHRAGHLRRSPAAWHSFLGVLSRYCFRKDGFPSLTTFAVAFALIWGAMAVYDWRTETVRGDFARYSLAASHVLWEGGNPYDRGEVGRNYKYQPVNIVLLWPFTLVPLPIAQGFWVTMNLALITIALWVQWRMLRELRLPPWIMLAVLVLGFRAIHSNLKLGQWNTSVYALGIIGAMLLFKHRSVIGSLVLGLAASLKFIPAVFVLPFLLKGRWRPALGTGLAVGFWCLLLPSLLLGPQRLLFLYQEFGESSAKVAQDQVGLRGERVGVSLNALVYLYTTPSVRSEVDPDRTINMANLTPDGARRLANGVSAALFIVTVLVSLGLRRVRPPRVAYFLEVSLWITTMMLILPHVRVHYLIYITTPMLGLLAFWYRWRYRTPVAWVAFGAVAFSLLAQILSSRDIIGLHLSENFNLYGTNTLMLLVLHATLIQGLWALQGESAPPEGPPQQERIADHGHAA